MTAAALNDLQRAAASLGMMATAAHMDEVGGRWRAQLAGYLASPALIAAVECSVNAFFARHPDLERTPRAAAFIAGLALEIITQAADSQSAAGSEAETKTKKVA